MKKGKIPGGDCIGCRALEVLGMIALAIVELEGDRDEMIRITGTTEGPARMSKQFTDLLRDIYEKHGIGVDDIRQPKDGSVH